MFVILRVNETPKSVFKKAKQRKKLAASQAVSMPTERGLPFFILDVPSYINNASWNNISEKCGRYASRIVAPHSFALPDHGNLKRFIPYAMPSILIFNTAKETIKKAELEPQKICITITDRNAVHSSKICSILPFASVVRVVTAHPEKYAGACEKAFDEHGASIIIRSAYEPASKPDIIICCDGVLSPSMRNAAVFSYKHKSYGKIDFCGSGIELAPNHQKIIPINIDPIDFTGALTELCGSSEYKSSLFSSIESSCSLCQNPAPESCLRCFVSGRL